LAELSGDRVRYVAEESGLLSVLYTGIGENAIRTDIRIGADVPPLIDGRKMILSYLSETLLTKSSNDGTPSRDGHHHH